MSIDLIKLQGDLIKMKGILDEYTAIFEASGEGIDSKERVELNKIQDKINSIESKLHESLGDNSMDTNNPAVLAFEKEWQSFIQVIEGDITKYGLEVAL